MERPTKRARVTDKHGEQVDAGSHHSDAGDPEHLKDADGSEAEFTGDEDGISGTDTDDEIASGALTKSKKTQKRRLRATSPSRFGATLTQLLDGGGAPVASLTLKSRHDSKRREDKEQQRVKKTKDTLKVEVEEKGRIVDVIGGWGGEKERALRKVAQRGVIKLFNAIQQAQQSNLGDRDSTIPSSRKNTKSSRGQNKVEKARPLEKDNILGRGKLDGLNQDQFFSLLKGSPLVSKLP